MKKPKTLRITLDDGAYMPERAHSTDAGLDLKAMHEWVIKARGTAVIATGVHIELPEGTCGLLVSKSGMCSAHGITSTGLIDQGYTGAIAVMMQNHSDKDYTVKSGDKVSQLVIMPCYYPSIEIVTSLSDTERGNDGFGSTGK